MKKILTTIFFSVCLFASTVFALDKVDINTATLQQLDTLTGIGPVYAQRIIDGRPYSSVDDLDRVKGIGPTTLQKIKDQGLAYVSGQTNQVPQASAVAENIEAVDNTTPTPTPNIEANGTLSDTSKMAYPSNVFINELMPNPDGPDETDEWIELYNSNNFDVDLSGWKIQDTFGTPTTYTIPQGTKILAGVPAASGSFLILKRPDTKIMLNNEKDGLNLLTPDVKIVDSINFTLAPLKFSYNKTGGTLWQWSKTPTPGAKNIVAAKTSSTIGPKESPALLKTKNSVKNDGIALGHSTGEAALSQTINLNQKGPGAPSGSYPNKNNPWFLFFTVLTITIILSIVVLLIKLKLGREKTTSNT